MELIKIKMIKEEYIPLLLSHQIGGITTIGDTHTLCLIVKRTKPRYLNCIVYLKDRDIVRIILIHNLIVIGLALVSVILWTEGIVMKKEIKQIRNKNS